MPAIFRGWTGQMTIIRFLSGVLVLAAFSVTLADSLGLKSVQRPMSDLRPAAKIAVPGSPDWVGIGDSVWISNNPKNNISQLDSATNKVGTVITVASSEPSEAPHEEQ